MASVYHQWLNQTKNEKPFIQVTCFQTAIRDIFSIKHNRRLLSHCPFSQSPHVPVVSVFPPGDRVFDKTRLHCSCWPYEHCYVLACTKEFSSRSQQMKNNKQIQAQTFCDEVPFWSLSVFSYSTET